MGGCALVSYGMACQLFAGHCYQLSRILLLNRDARDDGLRKQTCTLKKKAPQNCKRCENILAPIVQNKSVDPMDNAIVSLLCWGVLLDSYQLRRVT